MISLNCSAFNSPVALLGSSIAQRYQFFLCRICPISVEFWSKLGLFLDPFPLTSLNLPLSLLANSNALASISSIFGRHDDSITNNYNKRLAGTTALL